MKRLLFTLLLFSVVGIATAQTSSTLVLHHADGKTSEVELYTMPRIQLQADKMVISSQGISQEFSKADVVRFTYKGINTGINTVKPETRYRVDEDCVTFFGLSAADRISVHNANGVQIPVRLTPDGQNAVLSFAQLPQGVYLVTINGRTLKFVRP